MKRADMFRRERDRARDRGDLGVYRAMSAELERLGYMETVEAAPMERADGPGKRRRGRPPRPRCEHGKIVGRCLDCDDDLEVA